MFTRKVYKRCLAAVISIVLILAQGIGVSAYPVGSINAAQLSESEVLAIIKDALKNHVTYAQSIYHSSTRVPATGYFGTGNSGEHGVRTNADYALMYAFLYSKFRNDPEIVVNGNPVPWLTIRDRAIAAFKYAFNTHETGTYTCNDGAKWGRQWESSLWTQALGMAAWLVWDDLIPSTKTGVTNMITNEADYNNGRTPKVNEWSDTGAEENGWDTNILALARNMFDATGYIPKINSFAMNTYSTSSDDSNSTIVTGTGISIANWVLGANLHPDYTMENHGIFHPVYQMVPIQELSESAVFYGKAGRAVPETLKHNIMNVWNNVLKKIVLADGEWAYPNGIDWSINDYEHLEAYSALATLFGDMDAKFLESRLVQYMRARQLTTPDKAFLLNPDVGERRQGVIAHRLVYAYLLHDYFGPVPAASTTWNAIEAAQQETKLFPYTKVIRGLNSHRFTSFSWNASFMGQVIPKSENYLDNPYVIFPFKTGNTGNFTGYFDVTGKTRNAAFQYNTYSMSGNSYATAGYFIENGDATTIANPSLDHYAAFFQTPGNAVVYMDEVKAKTACTITKEGGIPLGIVTDTICGDNRTLYYNGGSTNSNGGTLVSIPGNWVNVDEKLGMVVSGGQGIRFGERALTNSINVSKLYGSYSTTSRSFTSGQVVASRIGTVYSNIDAGTTANMAAGARYPSVSSGWKAAAVMDPDNRRYLVAANLYSTGNTNLSLSYSEGAPVFKKDTSISVATGSTTLDGTARTAQIHELGVYAAADSGTLTAIQGSTPYQAYIKNPGTEAVAATIKIWNNGNFVTGTANINPGEVYLTQLQSGAVSFSIAAYPAASTNLALASTMSATSSQASYPPAYANDGSTSTFWVSNTNPSTYRQCLASNFSTIHKVNKVQVISRANYGPKDLIVEVSTDGTNFKEVAAGTLANAEGPHTLLFDEVDALQVRIKVISSYSSTNVQVKELQVYGK